MTRKNINIYQMAIDKALTMCDYMKVMRERSDLSKRTEKSDHKDVLKFTLKSDEDMLGHFLIM